MVQIGDPAPNAEVVFSSKGHEEEIFELETAYGGGTTILYFFPAAFTKVCTESNCELSEDLESFADIEANIFAISTDMPFTHQQFIQSYEIRFPLLSDFNKNAIEAFGVVDNNYLGLYRGVAYRSLFAIKGGKIIYKWVSEDPYNYPPFVELKKSLFGE